MAFSASNIMRKNLYRLLALHSIAFVGVFLLPVEVFAQENFVPLTSLPGLDAIAETKQVINGESLPAFFNSLYRLCIGAAAIIAVVQIIRAGITFMTNKESVSANKDAKALLAGAVLGMVLVLSPVIVFGIINPDILRLDLNLNSLQVNQGGDAEFSGSDAVLWVSNQDRTTETARCEASGGIVSYHCINNEGVSRKVPATQSCNAGEGGRVVCRAKDTAVSSQQQCLDYTVAAAGNNSCDATKGYVPLPNGCCGGGKDRAALCCGKLKNSSPEQSTSSSTVQSNQQL